MHLQHRVRFFVPPLLKKLFNGNIFSQLPRYSRLLFKKWTIGSAVRSYIQWTTWQTQSCLLCVSFILELVTVTYNAFLQSLLWLFWEGHFLCRQENAGNRVHKGVFLLSLEWKNLTGLHRAMTSTSPTPLGWTGMPTVSRITSHQRRTSLRQQQQLSGRESMQPVFKIRKLDTRRVQVIAVDK